MLSVVEWSFLLSPLNIEFKGVRYTPQHIDAKVLIRFPKFFFYLKEEWYTKHLNVLKLRCLFNSFLAAKSSPFSKWKSKRLATLSSYFLDFFEIFGTNYYSYAYFWIGLVIPDWMICNNTIFKIIFRTYESKYQLMTSSILMKIKNAQKSTFHSTYFGRFS